MTMLEEVFPCRLFLGPEQILGPMSSSYVTAVVNGQPNGVIVPVSSIVVIYTAGDGKTIIPYGGDPNVQIGYPDAPIVIMQLGVSLFESVSQIRFAPPVTFLDVLTKFVNQPLIVSLANTTATYGSIATIGIANGGTDYLAGDTFTLSAGNGDATGVVDAVNAITGAVTAVHLTTAGTGYPAGGSPSATTTDSIAGAGLTIDYTILQGNGSLYVEFDYKIMRIPLLASTIPSWPVVY